MKDDKEFLEALESRKVPILVLDQKWHRLFALSGKTSEIKQLEEKVNQLLEQQGKLNNDLKELKKTKNRLMKSIVVNMEGTHEENEGDISSRKLDEDKRLIDEVNVKMEEIEDELIELPRNINSANQELMLESMRYCYERLRQNSKEADEITAWIDKVRVELKKNIKNAWMKRFIQEDVNNVGLDSAILMNPTTGRFILICMIFLVWIF